MRNELAINRGADLLVCKTGAPICMLHHELARLAKDLVMHIKRGADREACVTGGGLDINALKRSFFKDFSIGDAIEGDAAR